jgi:hypothetical protein
MMTTMMMAQLRDQKDPREEMMAAQAPRGLRVPRER